MPVSKAPALSSLLIGGEKVAVFSSHVLPQFVSNLKQFGTDLWCRLHTDA